MTLVGWLSLTWCHLLKWTNKYLKKKEFKYLLARLALLTLVYFIWEITKFSLDLLFSLGYLQICFSFGLVLFGRNRTKVSYLNYFFIWHLRESWDIIVLIDFEILFSDTTKSLMSSPKCRSVEVINNPARPRSNYREVNCINYK